MRNLIDLSPNISNKNRSIKSINYVIIHYTGMQSEIESINWLKNLKSKVSCHYLINRKGYVIQMAKENKVAWHAGKSRWKKLKNLNNISIGIELVNRGHQYGYENFTKLQIDSVISLCLKLKKKFKIDKENFLGHSDIAPLRKIDPGEKFPWKRLSKFNLGKWYKFNKKAKIPKDVSEKYKLFFKSLNKIGYRYFKINKRSYTDKEIIKAFQRKFTPKKINGKIDDFTFKISQSLID